MKIPRLIITAPKSGSGKTLITICLIKALSMTGKKVSAFKCGPDYIDSMFHKKILGVPSKNLDLFFTDEETTKSIFCQTVKQNKSDIAVIEGVMGFYDGLSGISAEASTSHLAKVLQAPAVLVVDCKGMARSVLAEIAGFVQLDEEKSIKAVILNNMSQPVYDAIRPEIEKRFGITVLGYFPRQKNLALESRYLGLCLPDEIADIEEKVAAAAKELTKTVNLELLLKLAEEKAPEMDFQPSKAFWLCDGAASMLSDSSIKTQAAKTRIAVALDEAFCFYYEDNLKLLEYYGAELVYFSPVHDKKLPENVNGILLGGGYPELFALQLEENASMREAVKAAVDSGVPVAAECGGFMYLHDSIKTKENKSFKMCGIIKGEAFYTEKLVRFGYVTIDKKIRGHEFHYFDSTANGTDCTAVKPVTGKSWQCGYKSENRRLGFAHLYYPSAPEFAENFVKAAENEKINS